MSASRSLLLLLSVLALPAAGAGCSSAPRDHFQAAPSGSLASVPQYPHAAVCPDVAPAGHARCFAHVRTDAQGNVLSSTSPQGYGPGDLQSAYGLPGAGGQGKVVAVVDADDDPNAESDLAVYRDAFGLPPCTSASGCFVKVDQDGGKDFPQPSEQWAHEISLDLDMVSAVCPACRIVLVEAYSTAMTDLGNAVNTAVNLGATAVTNSYGGAEDPTVQQTSGQFYKHPGVLIAASSGDSGYGVTFPASSPYVIGVGGTTLVPDGTTSRGWSEAAWSLGGSGCSAYFDKPGYQHDPACGRRTVTDIAAVADPDTGVAVFDTYHQAGWIVVGGTSAAAPIVAAAFSLTSLDTQGALALYANPTWLFDVTTGQNGDCGTSLCQAQPGYDGPTGLGTPNLASWPGVQLGGSTSSSGAAAPSGGGWNGLGMDLTPAVSIDGPAPEDSFALGDTVPVLVNATSPSGISSVSLTWSNAQGSERTALTFDGGTQWSVNLKASMSGNWTLTTTAYDPHGDSRTTSVTIQVSAP